jgi:hypothetical protein
MAQDSAELDGTTDGANDGGSESGNGQQRSATGTDVAKTLADLQQKVDLLTRSLQSDKDRAVKKVGQRLDAIEGDLREVLQTAKREGKSVDDVLADIESAEEREMREALREMARSFKDGKFQASGQGGSSKQTGVDVSEVLADLELDAEDTRVQAFRAKPFASIDEAYREGAKLRKSIKTTQPSDADQASNVATPRGPAPKQDQLMKEYREGSKDLYGRQLLLYKQEMRKKGLNIS